MTKKEILDKAAAEYNPALVVISFDMNKMIMAAMDEFAKEVAIGFHRFMVMNYTSFGGRYIEALTKEKMETLDDWPDLDTIKYFSIDELYLQYTIYINSLT